MAIGQFMPMFAGVISDPYWSSVVAMLHFNGSNGSTSFPDTSTNGLVLSTAGNTQISTAQSVFGGGSVYFDGTGDYLFANSPALPAIAAQAYTIEGWVYCISNTQVYNGLIDLRATGSGSEPFIAFVSGTLTFYAAASSRFSLASFPTNTWSHVAFVRQSTGAHHAFVNGVRLTGTYSATTSLTSRAITLGSYVDQRNTAVTNKFTGYMNDLRLTYGVARYTENFTPPTQPFPDF